MMNASMTNGLSQVKANETEVYWNLKPRSNLVEWMESLKRPCGLPIHITALFPMYANFILIWKGTDKTSVLNVIPTLVKWNHGWMSFLIQCVRNPPTDGDTCSVSGLRRSSSQRVSLWLTWRIRSTFWTSYLHQTAFLLVHTCVTFWKLKKEKKKIDEHDRLGGATHIHHA